MDASNSVVITSDSNVLSKIIGFIIGFGAIAIIVGFFLGILWYILQAIGIYKLSKNRDIEPAWLAWIPIGQNYLLGELIGNKVWGFGYANWILVGIPIISLLISYFSDDLPDFLAVIFLIVIIAFYVYMMCAMYKLYKMYSTKPVLFLVLSIIFPFLASIFIFAIRNNKPDMTVAEE